MSYHTEYIMFTPENCQGYTTSIDYIGLPLEEANRSNLGV